MIKILVMEDDENIRLGLCHILRVKGFDPQPATCLAEAREKYKDCALCLLDVMLPDGSGVDLCREIRAESDVPIIFLTCVDDNTRIVRALELGADDYVVKPFDSAVLLARVNAALRRSGVTEEHEDIELTAIERSLLEYFRQNKNRILTREQILARLWDSRGEFVNDNTLSVRINRLRAKLEKSGSAKSGRIVTVKGVGYKWED